MQHHPKSEVLGATREVALVALNVEKRRAQQRPSEPTAKSGSDRRAESVVPAGKLKREAMATKVLKNGSVR